MEHASEFEIFLVGLPGLEAALADEARSAGFSAVKQVPGGVSMRGDWPEIWRANLTLRGATRVLVRLGSFRAMHLAQLDKRARKFPWQETLSPEVPLRVEVTCRKSRIYHAGAAKQRIETALRESLGVEIAPDAPLQIKARIEDDLCTFSLDTSGESLHRRGHKEFVGKAPLRETMAALLLRQCDFDGTEPVLDPMCGSGTFVLEAAEIAAGLLPGRSRSFAFEQLASFDRTKWEAIRNSVPTAHTDLKFYGSDRDAGAIRGCEGNASRAGVSGLVEFRQAAFSDLERPEGPPGLVIVNPPYGARIGNKKLLYGLYGSLGKVLMDRFSGWRVGIVTSESGLAKATGLPFLETGPPVAHGGLKVRLFRTAPLPG
ncbi:THUMP domain-containing class I SAM-dependent RNA methyltransferase [Primorskyibacter sp. S87]|uniref:THUMP domain-containing class I SAM-dependent RNA methyltransferase n=1 Tax=Primorskyibacter sp. S87 TaxID=3415126 RepID=UPI003C7D71BF